MPSISVGREESEGWVVARWAYCGILEHVQEEVREDYDLHYCVEEAIALDGLHLDLLESGLTSRLVSVLLRVANEVVAGSRAVRVDGRTLDEPSQAQFRKSVGDLRSLLQRHYSANP